MFNYRLTFEKGERVKYISHLDLNRCFIRAIKRAELPVYYTEGFNPHPYLVFPPPLSVGLTSKGEIMDMFLYSKIPANTVMKELNNTLPNGIIITKAAEPKSKLNDIAFALYKIELEDIALNELEKIKTLPEIKVIKKTKKGEREIELKPCFSSIDFKNNENSIHFEVMLPCDSINPINPLLLIEAINKYLSKDITANITRISFYNSKKELFS